MSPASALATRQRLRAHADQSDLLFERVLEQYARERLLGRLTGIPLAEGLVARGGTAIAARLGVPHRLVRRLDLLHTGEGSQDRAMAALREATGTEGDDLFLDPATLRATLLDPDRPNSRIRVKLFAYLAGAEIPLQLEISFAASVAPDPELVDLPVLPDTPPLRLPVARFETIAAECLREITARPRVSRRMTDYFDLWMCLQVDPLEGLEDAVRAAFEARADDVPAAVPDGLSERFAASEHARRQWDVFTSQGGLEADVDLEAIAGEIRERTGSQFED